MKARWRSLDASRGDLMASTNGARSGVNRTERFRLTSLLVAWPTPIADVTATTISKSRGLVGVGGSLVAGAAEHLLLDIGNTSVELGVLHAA
jgi:hypothetical protein